MIPVIAHWTPVMEGHDFVMLFAGILVGILTVRSLTKKSHS